jgi:hypothetical protein
VIDEIQVDFGCNRPGSMAKAPCKKELLYKKAQFNMAQFRGMIYGLMGQMRRIMLDESLFCTRARASDVPEIPWSKEPR